MSSFDYLDLCRLCLVKDQVSVPIFEGDGDARQIFHKISFCLPVKVDREDKLPKKICDDCAYKVELCYQFYNTTANAEKQLLQWLGEVGLEDKQDYEQEVMNSDMMKQEPDNRINVTVLSSEEQSNNMEINMIDGMSLSLPIIMTNQQMPAVSMSSTDNLQNIQSVAGTSVQTTRRMQKDGGHEEIEDTEEDDNSEDECDVDEGMQVVKEESENSTSGSRSMEPTTFVNVALSCNEAGPSGLQQQKLGEISEMGIQQSSEGDTKTGFYVSKITTLSPDQCHVGEMKVLCEGTTHELVLTEQTLRVAKDENLDEIVVPVQTISQCELCGDGFISEKDLELHLNTHDHLRPRHEYQLMEDVEEETAEEIVESTEIDDDKVVYVCEHCGRSFMNAAVMSKHQQQMHNNNSPQKLYSCELCTYTSPHRQNLISHERRHNQEYKYHCDICGTGFYTRNSYEEHQLMHSQEKPFQCEICNATFRYRQGLRLHAKLHQPDYVPPQKKHLCELCNKRFSRKQVLLVHMRTHGNSGQQSEYTCPICGKGVSSKTYLTVHMRKHTGEKPHVCDHCGKSFISQNYLSVHRRTHTGERPHKCTHCEKRFTQRTTLVVHLRGHTGDRPYPCTICHKSFASKTMLNSHLKTHAKQTAREQQHELHLQPEHLEEENYHDQLEMHDSMQDSMQDSIQDSMQDSMHDSMHEPDHITEHITDHLQVEDLHPDELHHEELQDQPQTRVIETVSVLLSG